MSASAIRIATIGTWGHIGQPLGELGPLPDVRFVAHARALPDDDPSLIRRITRDESVPWHDDYRRMLREVRPDLAIISTRLDRINPIASEAAEAGCHSHLRKTAGDRARWLVQAVRNLHGEESSVHFNARQRLQAGDARGGRRHPGR